MTTSSARSSPLRVAAWLIVGMLLGGALPAGAFEVRSRMGRYSIGGYIEGNTILRTDRNTPSQNTSGLLDLKLTADPHPKVRFFLETHALAGGTPKDGDFGLFNLSDTFQNKSPSLAFEEGYADLALPNAGLRIGMQKFAWGRLDRYQPTDVINPQRYYDPLLTDEQDAKIGVPSLRASVYPPAGRLLSPDTIVTLVWVPVPFPLYFPLPAERWFPPAVRASRTLRIPQGSLFDGVPLNDITSSNVTVVRNRRPPQQLDEGAVGVRIGGTTNGVDWALSYYDGMETAPNFDLATRVRCASADLAKCQVDTIKRLRAVGTLRPRFDRIHLVGADTAFQVSGFTVRAEAAYGMDRRLPRPAEDIFSIEALTRAIKPRDLGRLLVRLPMGKSVPITLEDLFVTRDVLEWGAGIDSVYNGWLPLLQVNQTLVLNNDTRLLVNDTDTRVMFVLRKSFRSDTLHSELVAAQGLPRSYTLGLARLTYAITDSLRVRVGFLLVAGSRNTLIGEYHSNDEAFIQLRYSY